MFKRSKPSSSAPDTRALALDEFARAVQAAATRGRRGSWAMHLDEAAFGPDLTPLVSAFNTVLDTVQVRQNWYEAILDAVPFFLSVTDLEMNWTFVNKPMEDLAGVQRKDLVGKHCSNLGAPTCKTPSCGVTTLRRGEVRSRFEMAGKNLQIDTTYVVDRDGNQLGHMEVIQDTTALVRAANYQQREAERVARYLDQLADGDLSFTPEITDADEHTQEARENFVQIANGMERTLTNLRELVGELQASASDVAAAGAQIHAASQQSAETTQEVAGTVQRVAVEAQTSTDAATGVNQIAQTGRETVQQTVEAMRSIDATVAEAGAKIREMRDRSTRIGAIVQTIDEIADQTNLLALNAAIEAARAGEHGRGFAVVAEEVRKLADRSSEATREIGGLIREVQSGIQGAAEAMDRTIGQVDAGAELAGAAGSALGQISEAAAQSVEQARRILEDAQAVAATTEEMTAQVEEQSASAETLARVSVQLREHTARFTLESREPLAFAPPSRGKRAA